MNFKTRLLGLMCFSIFCWNSASANDEPCTATEITVSTACSNTTFSNATATNTISVPDPGCAGYSGGDIWFTFTMPNYGYHTVLEMSAGIMTDGGMAVYSGTDCSSLTLISCDDNSGTGNMPSITVDDGCGFQYAGATFWVRVWENGNDNNGTFDICAYTTAPPVPAGVSSCGGNLIAGNACCDAILLGEELNGYCGNTGSYTDIPDEITGFCAFIDNNAWLAFVASETSVDIGIVSSGCVATNGIQVAILETSDCTNFTVLSNCWNPGAPSSGNLIATGLTIGETYYIMVDGWAGDICDYTLSIVSGVETVSISVDDDEICQGESTQLHANVVGSGTYTYNWAPAGSLDDATSPNPIATPTVTTDYTVTITGVSDDIHTLSVTVYPSAPTTPVISGNTSVCENSTGTIYTVAATNGGTYNWIASGGATITGGHGTDSIIVDWGSTGGSLCVEAENNCGMSAQECLIITTTGLPIITADDPPAACAPDPFNLFSIVVNNTGSAGSGSTYYDNLNDAIAGTNDIFPPVTNTPGTYYIRMATGPDCYDIDSVEVVIEDPALVVVNPGIECSPDFIDLDNVIINEVNGYSGGTKTYYTDSLDAVNTNGVLMNTQVYTAGTYWVRYDTPGGCFVVAPIEIIIDVTPSITINQPPPLCPGGSIDLDTISFTDANNAVFTKYFFTVQLFADNGWNNLAIPTIISTCGITYYMRAETPNNCFEVVEIFIPCGVTPDAAITGSGTFCEGEDTDITFTLNGSGPFDVVYNNGIGDVTLNNISNNHQEPFTVTTDSIFTLVSVSDANGCTGNLLGSQVDIIANPAPTAQISGDATICNSGLVNIDFAFTGIGPFNAEYTDGTDTFDLIGVPTNHSVAVNVSSTTTYTLVSVTDNGACSGTVSGSATITAVVPIEINNKQETCDASFTMYTVSFEITEGMTGTYTVTGGTGSLVGNVFTSDPIMSGTAYSFMVSDSSPCPPVSVSGNQNCSCATDAGQMDLTPIYACDDETAQASFITGSNTLNPGDIFRYVLHDNSGGVLGTPIEFSNTPEFVFQTPMNYNITYYISPIAGPDDGSGQVDFAHVCFSIGQGTPVVFYQRPQASISGSTTNCPGESTDLTFNFPIGTGPFNIEVSPDNAPSFIVSNVNDGDTYSVMPSTTTTYTLLSVEDNTGAQCSGTVSGSAIITIQDAIQISNIIETCDASFTTYTISFEISGGVPSGYTVGGNSGTLSGNTFTSDPITSGSGYTFTVNDGSGCPDETITGVHDCVCTTDAGAMDLTSINVCEDETAIASFMTGSNTLMPGDVFQFVLHDSPTASLGNILDLSNTPEFSIPGMANVGTTYYISPIAGPNDGSGNVDTNHLCFSIAPGTPVVFYQLPTATISGDASICENGTTNLVFNFSTGVGPWDVVIEDSDGTPTSIDDLSDGGTFAVNPTSTTTYTIVNVTDSSPAVCSGSGSGSATITVNAAPQIINIEFLCNNTNTQYQVSFEITGGDPSSYVVNGDPGNLDNSTNTFLSDFINSGTAYSFQIDDANNCGPTDLSDTYTCACTSDAGEMATNVLEICEDGTAFASHIMTTFNLDGNDVLGFVLYDPLGTFPASVMYESSTPEFNYETDLNFGTTYHIAAVVADDAGTGTPVLDDSIDPCLSFSNGQPVVFFENPEVSISGTNTICQGDSTDIVFTLTGTGPFDIVYNDGSIDHPLLDISDGHIIRVGPNVTTTYTLVSVNLNNSPFCNGTIDITNNSIIIDVIEIPVVSNVNSSCNQLGTEFTISFEITGGNAGSYNVSGDPGTLTGNIFISDPIAGGSTYTFQVEDGSGCQPIILTATEYCNCTPDIKPTISLEEVISCNGESDGVLSVTNENGQAPFDFNWSSGFNGTIAESLSSGWHFVTMTDGNNCTSVDSVFLDQPIAIEAEVVVTPMDCYGEEEGIITFENVTGGSGGYTFSIDYYTTYIENSFYDLPAGSYEATVEDSDGCTWIDTVSVLNPTELILDIGEDTVIEFGDSIRLRPYVSLLIDTFAWGGGVIECPGCWDQVIYPTDFSVYTLTVITEEGCEVSDELIVEVTKERPIYIPNIFSPNGDGNNDEFKIYTKGGIEIVKNFRVFDRWGASVYEVENMIPGIDDFGWDGRLKGEDVVQGVYVYFLEVVYIDGTSEIIRGDVTLLR